MVSLISSVDYVNTNFEYPVLTKISSVSTYESLKILKNELKGWTQPSGGQIWYTPKSLR